MSFLIFSKLNDRLTMSNKKRAATILYNFWIVWFFLPFSNNTNCQIWILQNGFSHLKYKLKCRFRASWIEIGFLCISLQRYTWTVPHYIFLNHFIYYSNELWANAAGFCYLFCLSCWHVGKNIKYINCARNWSGRGLVVVQRLPCFEELLY